MLQQYALHIGEVLLNVLYKNQIKLYLADYEQVVIFNELFVICDLLFLTFMYIFHISSIIISFFNSIFDTIKSENYAKNFVFSAYEQKSNT